MSNQVFAKGVLPGTSLNPVLENPRIHDSHATEWSTVYRRRLDSALSSEVFGDGLKGWQAIKVVDLNVRRKPHDPRKEAKVLAMLSNPNIIPLLCANYSSPNIQIHIPLYPITLFHLLQSTNFTPSKFTAFTVVAKSLIYQIAQGVNYIHKQGVAHRDLAPGNVMISESGRAVLGDFGTAWKKDMAGAEPVGNLEFELGTMPYRAPELLFGSRHYSPQAMDLWSLGALIANFFTAFEVIPPPYPPPPKPSVVNNIGPLQDSAVNWYSQPVASFDAIFGADVPVGGQDEEPWTLPPMEGQPVAVNETEEKWERTTLFEGKYGDFALIGSIFKVRGTPTVETWPEAANLPDFGTFIFHDFPPQPLSSLLPNVPEQANHDSLLNLISRLLEYSSTDRLPAAKVIDHKWFVGNHPSILSPGQGEWVGKTLGAWLEPWIAPRIQAIEQG